MDNFESKMWSLGRKKLNELKNEFNGDELDELTKIIHATYDINYTYRDKIYNMLEDFMIGLDEDKSKKVKSLLFIYDKS